MPITFSCACGTTLRVNDSLAGRSARCPACKAVTTIPAADPGFEVVEDEPPPPPRAAPVKAARRADDEDDNRPLKMQPRYDEDDDRPRKRRKRRTPRYEYDDGPRRGGHSGLGLRRGFSVIGGLALIVISIVGTIALWGENRIWIGSVFVAIAGFGMLGRGLTGEYGDD